MKNLREELELGKRLMRENPTFGSRRIAKLVKETFSDIDVEKLSNRLRQTKRKETLNAFETTLEENNFTPPENWNFGWVKTKNASVFIKNPDIKNGETVSYEKMRDDVVAEMKAHSPSFKKIERRAVEDGHLLVIDVADLHIGKLASETETGEKYNSDIAVERALHGVAGIIEKTNGFNIDRILFVIGNDVLHSDTPKGQTTSGTQMDISGMWYDNFVLARKMYVGIIEALVQMCDVDVVHTPSNHEYMSGFMLADSVSSWFSKCDNVTFDVSNAHRKYYRYHNSLIGLSHGDGAKMQDMPLLMANESKHNWAETDHRYVYLHHIHHMNKVNFQSGKDYQGVTVEYLRSPSSSDSWHHRNGYQHAPKAVEGFVHSKNFGQVAKISHIFR